MGNPRELCQEKAELGLCRPPGCPDREEKGGQKEAELGELGWEQQRGQGWQSWWVGSTEPWESPSG